MSLFAMLAGFAMITLNYATYYTVISMGGYVQHLDAVGVTWTILRDLGNIMLIFGFLAVGVSIIINSEWYGGGKKMLPMLLVAAIFINFSLFFAEAIVDTGNLFAAQFYKQINGGVLPTPGTLSTQGVSDKIMSQLKLQGLYNTARSGDGKAFSGANPFFIGFMGILLFIILAFVLFSLSFILIARLAILIVLLIVAPIGFAGLAVPQLKKRADEWWSKLFEQTITAPILFLLLYIALKVITAESFLSGLGGANFDWLALTSIDTNAQGAIAAFAPALLSFLLAMALLLLVVIQAKNLGAAGAAGATKLAGKLSFGAVGWAGRGTVGWGASRLAKMARGSVISRIPLVGTGLTRGLEGVAASSFDVRGATLGGGLKAAGVNAGEAQKGGYRADLKARTESRTKYASELTGRELTDDEKIEQAAVQNQIKGLQKQRGKAQTKEEIRDIDKQIKEKEGKLGEIEKGTAKDAQNKYASVLELGRDPKGPFNKYFNFAANTDAAKTIRANAKKGKPDKDWSENMKKLLKEAGGDEGEGGPEGSPPGGGGSTPPGGGSGGGGGRGGGGGGREGGSPPSGFQQNPGGNILVPNNPGNGPRSQGSGGGARGGGGVGGGSVASAVPTPALTGFQQNPGGIMVPNTAGNGPRAARNEGSAPIDYDSIAEQAYARMDAMVPEMQAQENAFRRAQSRVRNVDEAERQAHTENARYDQRAAHYAENRVQDVDKAQTMATAEDARRSGKNKWTLLSVNGQPVRRNNNQPPVSGNLSREFMGTFKKESNAEERGGRIFVPPNAGGTGLNKRFTETFKEDANPDERGGRITESDKTEASNDESSGEEKKAA